MPGIKKIKLSNGQIVNYNSETEDGYDQVYNYYAPKMRTLVKNWTSIPYHDQEDLYQICSLKLSEALKKFNTKKNINFSTYVYTVWNRKMAQLMLRYKSQKYSGYIKNDHYVHFNYPQDKKTGCHLLRLGVNKCPLQRDVIDKKMCGSCEFNKGFQNRQIKKGKEKGKNFGFSKCGYFKTILEQRGKQTLSLDKVLFDSDNRMTLQDTLPCPTQSTIAQRSEQTIDIGSLKDKVTPSEFKIISLIYQGWNKSQIIRMLNMNSVQLEKMLDTLSKNQHIKELLEKD